MNRQGLGITNISEVAEELQAIDEMTASFEASFDAETYKCAVLICIKILLGRVVVCVALKARVVDPSHGIVCLEELGDLECIFTMTLHS